MILSLAMVLTNAPQPVKDALYGLVSAGRHSVVLRA